MVSRSNMLTEPIAREMGIIRPLLCRPAPQCTDCEARLQAAVAEAK